MKYLCVAVLVSFIMPVQALSLVWDDVVKVTAIKVGKDKYQTCNKKGWYIILNQDENKYDDLTSSELTIDDLIKDVGRTKFLSLDKSQKDTILELLNQEKSSLDSQYENLLNKKIGAFVALVDYIQRNHEVMHHVFSLNKSDGDYIGDFSGEFKKELLSVQNVMDSNPIAFYAESNKPKLDFSKGFDSLMNCVEKNFISDYDSSSFNKIVKEYKTYKNSWQNVERKIKP